MTPASQTRTRPTRAAGQNIGFIEDGDYVSYKPVSLKDIRALTFRVASGGAGGDIEVRLDSPTGTLVGSAAVANTGGWQTWTNVTLPLDDPPAGTHELFLVFRNATNTGGLFNVNWIEAIGKGAATTEAPQVSADAEPRTGAAPLEVHFTGTATDADAEPGDTLTYRWDFGVAGTTDDTSTEKDPTLHVPAGRHVQRDVHGHRRRGRARVRHGAGRGHRRRLLPDECAVGRVRR